MSSSPLTLGAIDLGGIHILHILKSPKSPKNISLSARWSTTSGGKLASWETSLSPSPTSRWPHIFARKKLDWARFYLCKTAQIRAEMCWISLHFPFSPKCFSSRSPRRGCCVVARKIQWTQRLIQFSFHSLSMMRYHRLFFTNTFSDSSSLACCHSYLMSVSSPTLILFLWHQK